MKNLKLPTLIPFVLVLLISFSCQHEATQPTTKVFDGADGIGEFHNEGLDYILEQLKKNRPSQPVSNEEFLAISNAYGLEFVKLKSPDLKPIYLTEIESNTNSFQVNMINRLSESGKTLSIYDDMLAVAEPYLTSNQTSYVRQIFGVLVNQYNDLSTLNNSLNQIESSAQSNLSSSEMSIIQTAINIARSSSGYWNENSEEWENEICAYIPCGPEIGGKIKGDVNWGVVAAGDVAAGVVVGVSTSTALIVPFVGWGFWAAATGGAAAITSAGAAIIMLAS